MNLNEKQLEAVNTIDGPLLILAGAGAGKTKTITERVVNIIKSGVDPKNILCVTFTNKAAKEMLERIISRMKEENLLESYEEFMWKNKNIPTIKTFHSLGLSILREHAQKLHLNKNLSVLDPSDATTIIKEILIKLSMDPKLHDPSKIKNAISREKSQDSSIEDYAKKVSSYNMEIIEKVWRNYEIELEKRGLVDFDDLIIKTIELLKDDDIKKYYKNKFKYIHIDEYQDTNNSQYALMKCFIDTKNNNICVVGDIDQNIYSWRGANLKNILSFEKDFPLGKVILLEENYRSTQNILNLANISISKNKARFPKNLYTNKNEGEEIEICPSFDEKRESELITNKIKSLVKEKNIKLNNIVVLYRTNFQSRILEEAFIKANIPYNLLGTKFFERKEIKDIMSYLRASKNRGNLSDLKRVFETPKRGIGKASILKVFANESDTISASTKNKILETYKLLDKIKEKIDNGNEKLSEIITMIIIDSGIEEELLNGSSEEKERLENIRELVTITKKFDALKANEAYEYFIDEVALRSDQDDNRDIELTVKLMTIHSAKGLEFDYVFIAGLEEDLFPHIDIGNRKKTLEEEEEERRLFYVAVTRAKIKLFLCYSEMRTIYGEKKVNIPSRFLEDINELDAEKVIYHDIYYGDAGEETNQKKKRVWDFGDDEYEEEDFLEF